MLTEKWFTRGLILHGFKKDISWGFYYSSGERLYSSLGFFGGSFIIVYLPTRESGVNGLL
jgi:hypothetical protein